MADKPNAPLTDNPLREGPRMGRPPEPVAIVICGATGDLTARKLVPALFSLAQSDQLPNNYAIIGYARRDWTHEHFREEMYKAVSEFGRFDPGAADRAMWEEFARNLFYVQGNFDESERFAALDAFLGDKARERGVSDNRLYYLAAPPVWYSKIVTCMGGAGMAHDTEGGWRRVIIEKPFGNDLSTAGALNETVHTVFKEGQVYRIDHYLGKETVQNILVLRFANAIFEPIWNRRYVDHVQISVAESVGVEGRAEYYDKAGVMRDIFQNHILQIVTLVAMEPPVGFEADAIRDEKVKVLRAMHPIDEKIIATNTVRAQYADGMVDGERVAGYCEAEGVAEDSQTATYAALKWSVDNWRWQGVPFYMRSGKRMPTRASEVSIHFKSAPHLLFGEDDGDLRPNVLALRIQPDEGITLRFESKQPGQGVQRRPVTMDFRYGTSFGITDPPEAYERLLLDAILGDATLFARSDEIEWAWRLVDPVLANWESSSAPSLETYRVWHLGAEGCGATSRARWPPVAAIVKGGQWRRSSRTS